MKLIVYSLSGHTKILLIKLTGFAPHEYSGVCLYLLDIIK